MKKPIRAALYLLIVSAFIGGSLVFVMPEMVGEILPATFWAWLFVFTVYVAIIDIGRIFHDIDPENNKGTIL